MFAVVRRNKRIVWAGRETGPACGRRSPSRCNDQPSAIGSFPESGPWFTHRDTNENLVRLSGRVALLLVGVRGCAMRTRSFLLSVIATDVIEFDRDGVVYEKDGVRMVTFET